VTVFSLNNISGLRRSKNVKFGTKVASIMRMMHALRILEKVFLIVATFARMLPKKSKNANFSKTLAQFHLAMYTLFLHIRGAVT